LADVENVIADKPLTESETRKGEVLQRLAQLAAAGPPSAQAESTCETDNDTVLKENHNDQDDEDDWSNEHGDLPVPEWLLQHEFPAELRNFIDTGSLWSARRRVKGLLKLNTLINESYVYLYRVEGLRQIVIAQGVSFCLVWRIVLY
jgi:hypothetical protein